MLVLFLPLVVGALNFFKYKHGIPVTSGALEAGPSTPRRPDETARPSLALEKKPFCYHTGSGSLSPWSSRRPVRQVVEPTNRTLPSLRRGAGTPCRVFSRMDDRHFVLFLQTRCWSFSFLLVAMPQLINFNSLCYTPLPTGPSHPMKPHRLKLAHHLILTYGLYKQMDCYKPHPATAGEMAQFHSEDYVNFLSKVTPDNLRQYSASMQKFNAGETTDCPVFDGLYEFTQLYTGASMDGAVLLCQDKADVAINWSGGLHHAKKGEASGFCYSTS